MKNYLIKWSTVEENIEANNMREAGEKFNALHPETHDGITGSIYSWSPLQDKFVCMCKFVPSKY